MQAVQTSAGGTIIGTSGIDKIGVTSVGTSTTITTFNINLQDGDNKADDLNFHLKGTVAPTLVVVTGFDGEDAVGATNADDFRFSSSQAGLTYSDAAIGSAMGATTAALLIGAAIDETVSSGSLSLASAASTVNTGAGATAGATWVYGQDVYWLGGQNVSVTGTLSGFDAGDIVVKFVGAAGGMDEDDITINQ